MISVIARLVFSGAITFYWLQALASAPKTQDPPSQNAGTKRPGGQSASPAGAPPDSGKPGPSAATIPATEPVITLYGLCGDGTARPSDDESSCKTVITREQFEKLVTAFDLSGDTMRADTRRNLAKTYAELLALEAAAKKANLDNTEQFQEVTRWLRLRALTSLYSRSLQEKYRNPSQAEIDAYYAAHLSSYERIKAARIMIPRTAPTGTDKAEFDKKARDAASTARDRAEKGDDPEQIQKDSYSALGLGGAPPTDLGIRGRDQFLQEESDELFALKPGNVSRVEAEASSYVVYKVVSKETLSEDQVKNAIAAEISRRNLTDALQSAIGSVRSELNEQYFGAERATPAGGNPPPTPGGARPPHPQ